MISPGLEYGSFPSFVLFHLFFASWILLSTCIIPLYQFAPFWSFVCISSRDPPYPVPHHLHIVIHHLRLYSEPPPASPLSIRTHLLNCLDINSPFPVGLLILPRTVSSRFNWGSGWLLRLSNGPLQVLLFFKCLAAHRLSLFCTWNSSYETFLSEVNRTNM